jgi:hypothetical protein
MCFVGTQINRLVVSALALHSQHQTLDDIFYMGEVPALQSILKDQRAFPLSKRLLKIAATPV